MKRKLLITLLMFLVLGAWTDLQPASANTLQQSFQSTLVPVSKMELPAKTIIGFGEATHGNKQFTMLKAEIFKHLVEKQGYRAFAIEGDFGGAQKVNAYITGDSGTAENAAKEIGFRIYETQEMAELLAWMRAFNEERDAKEQIHFYGFDMQRYDHNKNGLFSYLKKVNPPLASQYEQALANLNDASVYDQKKTLVKDALSQITTLIAHIKKEKAVYTAKSSEKEYELALAYAESIKQNATLRGTNANYSTTRDRYMAEKVLWILAYEKKHYGRQNLFITGHNGHIEKTSTTFGMTTSMGAHLAKALGDQYYAIGSEFSDSTFLANDASTNEEKVFTVKNSGENRLAVMFSQTGMKDGFLDFEKTKHDESFYAYLNKAQPISAIGAVFGDWFGKVEKMYTLQMVPAKAFDALIFVRKATPSVMLPN